MDPELSLIMSNLAQVCKFPSLLNLISAIHRMSNLLQAREDALIYDPFVGTGLPNSSFSSLPSLNLVYAASMLYTCAEFGAHVCGSDINYTTLHGMGKTPRAIKGPKQRSW